MFSFITMNWRGRPLVSYRTIVELIANTTTKKGLKIQAGRDPGPYPTGVKVTKKELAAVPLTPHEFHGEWNYTINPSLADYFPSEPLAPILAASYRLSHERQLRFLAALDEKMLTSGLAEGGDFDLDFHTVMHWGEEVALEKHYVAKRSQRTRSVLTFFAQDAGTHNLVYANADVSKASQSKEVLSFCDHWKALSGKDPVTLVLDQRVTTHEVLAALDARGVRFITLRMRTVALIRHIESIDPGEWKTVSLDRDGNYKKPQVLDEHASITGYPGPVRQLLVRGLGRDAPTVIITNDEDSTARQIIERYARRMTIEQRLAEAIRSFHLDALSSAVPLNVDLDVVLSVLAGAVCASLRRRLGAGYAAATPDTLQRRFLHTGGVISNQGDTITVRLDRRTYSPVLRSADIPDTGVPWWGGRTLHFEYA